jgi:hypothetical protein
MKFILSSCKLAATTILLLSAKVAFADKARTAAGVPSADTTRWPTITD